jgi:hypothetical protein
LPGNYLNPTVLTALKAVLTHGIRTIIIHNITSPKSKATVFSISNLPARWGTRIGYHDTFEFLVGRCQLIFEPGVLLRGVSFTNGDGFLKLCNEECNKVRSKEPVLQGG